MVRFEKTLSRVLVVCLLVGGFVTTRAQSYERLWKKVEQAQEKSLPQTVVQLTDEIFRKAGREQNAGQLFKAYLYREAVKQQLTPDSLYAYLQDLEQWKDREENPANRAILHSLLASEYAGYLSKNRRSIESRTALQIVPADLREWSTNLFIDRIDAYSRASLADTAALLRASAADYEPFVVKGEGSRFYGHDLYHLLANRAMDTYRMLQRFGADTLVARRTEQIYAHQQAVYARRSSGTDALLLSTLHYWDWKRSARIVLQPRLAAWSYSQRRDSLNQAYLSVLDSLITRYGHREVCAEVYISKAELLSDPSVERMSETLQVCAEGLKKYPKYFRINQLKNIRENILHPVLECRTPDSCYPGDSLQLQVSYRNLSGFTLQLHRTSLAEIPWMDHGINKDTYRKYAVSHRDFRFNLTPRPRQDRQTEDWGYLQADTTLYISMPEEPGVYILRLLADGDAGRIDGSFLVNTRFKVLTQNLGGNQMEVVTLDGKSGHPIADARVSFYSSYDERDREVLAEVTTDAQGIARLTWNEKIRSYVARKGDDQAMRPQYIYQHVPSPSSNERQSRVTLLLDRAIYRPGQTVYVKGIYYSANLDSAWTLADKTCELALRDAGGKEIATRSVTTNDFGSFTADFVLPSACLNGQFRLQTKGNPYTSVTFRVEEYKRPTFEVTFNPPTTAYALGDSLTLTGQVKSYNGMSVQNVPLVYTVRSQSPFSSIWPPRSEPLHADTIRLDAEGRFALPLKLEEAPEDRGYFHRNYYIEATVTDAGGETQSASYTLSASKEAYFFDYSLPGRWCKEDNPALTVRVMNRNNVQQALSGTYRLCAVKNDKAESVAVVEGTFTSGRPIDCSAWKALPSGVYQLMLSVRDSAGRQESTAEHGSRTYLFSKSDKRLAVFEPAFCHYDAKDVEFNEEKPAEFLYGTSFRNAYVLMDLFGEKGRIESRVLQLNDTLRRFSVPYKEEYGQNAAVMFTFVKEGQLYTERIELEKTKPERKLVLAWSVFRDHLQPGGQEEWRLTIKDVQGMPAAAELLATMYDASLDKLYKQNQWLRVLYPYRSAFRSYRNLNDVGSRYLSNYFPTRSWRVPGWEFDRFFSPESAMYGLVVRMESATMTLNEKVVNGYNRIRGAALTGRVPAMAKSVASDAVFNSVEEAGQPVEVTDASLAAEDEQTAVLPQDANVRTNFNETAFFYPQLRTNEQGEVVFSFVMPESLTRWNFRGYAHTRNMMTGTLEATVITSKDFMLSPNLPRYIRVGDHTQLTATVANQTDKAIKGVVRFTLFEPATEKVISTEKRRFTVAADGTAVVSFAVEADDRYDLLGIRMVAEGDNFSDGEQHLLPVLSDKAWITETLPLPVRGKGTKTFALDSLFNHNSKSATYRRLTVEFTGNPAWYAIQALPTLGLPTTDNAISWASVLYAQTLASYVAGSQPRIRTLIDSWKAAGGTKETFLSQLEKNQEVKNILLAESPWVMEAADEAEQRARLATLFDVNKLVNDRLSALAKLKELQGNSGAWSWYQGMSPSRYITTYVTGLLLRLPMITGQMLDEDTQSLVNKALDYLHKEALAEYYRLMEQKEKGVEVNGLSGLAMDYLYLVALSGREVPSEGRKAYEYFLNLVPGNLSTRDMTCKARSAVILLKAGRKKEAEEFIRSLQQHLVVEEEQGAHFAFYDTPYSWGMMPIPVHVSVMEALRMAGGHEALLEEMKIWLLKQKQTTVWTSPVATVDAVYALICTGNDWLSNRGDVQITLGGERIETLPAKADASFIPGLAYVKKVFDEDSKAIKAKTAVVEKKDDGVAWGAVYAQYLAPLDDLRPQSGQPLTVKKQLFVERLKADGTSMLEPLYDEAGKQRVQVHAGDKVVSRLTLISDRRLDFVQLKDQRGSCFEPIGSLSGYRRVDGAGCYMEIEDAAANFFFDRLNKGVYVLEHSYRVARKGTYQAGIATLQCAYAPEFASHSAAAVLQVE